MRSESFLRSFEPLLNPSIEQQAVGRIHRIGQTEVTHVFQYVCLRFFRSI